MTSATEHDRTQDHGSRLDRVLGIITAVRPGEGARAVMLFASVLVLMVAYYLLKTAREPLVLASGGAELKTYATGAQALCLLAFVPFHGWLAARSARGALIRRLAVTATICLALFALAIHAGLAHVGVVFFVWVGIFSLSSIALFWSVATDLYDAGAGQRLFPLIALGATLGSPVGAFLAQRMFAAGIPAHVLVTVAALFFLAHTGLLLLASRGVESSATAPAPVGGAGGFTLLARSRYLQLLAGLLVLLNLVNTVGEYLLSRTAVAAAAAAVANGEAVSQAAYLGAFYGRFFLWVNVAALVLQAVVVSRLVKHLGVTGVILFLPLVALGVYGAIALGAGLQLVRVLKTAENAGDYSVMNTGKAMLWLSASREEKYSAKQAIDTFVVRAGDLLAVAVVFVGTQRLHLDLSRFAAVNVGLVVLWLLLSLRLLKARPRAAASAPRRPLPRLRPALTAAAAVLAAAALLTTSGCAQLQTRPLAVSITPPAALCGDPRLPPTAFCLPIEKVEALLRSDALVVRSARGTALGTAGAQVLTLEDPASGLFFKSKWKASKRGGDGFNNAPRKELAAYAMQQLFLEPSEYVVPPTIARCMPRGVATTGVPTFDGVDCAFGVLSYWLENVTSHGVRDDQRFARDAAFRDSVASMNLLAYLIDHRDTRAANFLVSTDAAHPRAFAIDNGLAFSGFRNPRAGFVHEWDELIVPAVPARLITRLARITRADLDRLLTVAEYRVSAGRLVPVAASPALRTDVGARRSGDVIQLGLTRKEIDQVEARLARLLGRVSRGALAQY